MGQTKEIVQSLCSHNATYRAPTKEICNYMCLYKGGSILLCRYWWRRWSWSPSWRLPHLLHGRWAKPYKLCMSLWMSALSENAVAFSI